MIEDYPARMRNERAPKSKTRLIATVALVGFLVGGAAAGIAAWQTGLFDRPTEYVEVPTPEELDAALPDATIDPSPTPSATASEPATARQVDQVVRQTGGLDQRIAALEQRLARLDLQAEAAAGNAARAESLLIAFSTRRTLERGGDLGFLADQLRLRFGEAKPRAVRTILDLSREPVRLDELAARLNGMEDDLVGNPEGEGFFANLSRNLGSLFIIRRTDTPSPQPERRVERAKEALQNGRVSIAIEEIRRLPTAGMAEDWLDDAERYVRLQDALEQLESAAILEPELLRDSEGENVTQPGTTSSPAAKRN